MKTLLVLVGATLLITAIVSFTLLQEDPWKVPPKYDKMKNPVAVNEASLTSGKEIQMFLKAVLVKPVAPEIWLIT